MDLQLFADGGEAAAPALSAAQEQQAVASGTMKPGEKADARQETTAPEGEKEVKETEPVKVEEGQEQEPPALRCQNVSREARLWMLCTGAGLRRRP